MLSYPSLGFGSIAILPVAQFLFLPVLLCVQSVHVPESPAEMQLINFGPLKILFGWVFLHHILGNVLEYININLLELATFFFTLSKKLIFLHFASSNE
jgi:hypothetical protein